VVKFRRGLNPEIGDAVATMATNRPDDLDPEAWYEAAVRIDQNRAANAAFRNSVGAPNTGQLPLDEPTIAEDLPKIPEDEAGPLDIMPSPEVGSDVLDIKNMSADDIRNLLQQLSACQRIDKPSPPPPKKALTPALPKKKLPAHPPNRYQTLTMEEAPDTAADASAKPEATCAKQP